MANKESGPELPPHLQFLRGVPHPFQAGALYGAVTMAYQIGAVAAYLAATEAGTPVPQAKNLENAVTVAAMEMVCEICKGFGPFADDPDPEIWNMEAIGKVDWSALEANLRKGQEAHA